MALFGGTACGPAGQFVCVGDDQCGAQGRCEADGYCSFADDACPSGRRYGEHAAPSLAGACVEPSTTSGASTSGAGPGSTTLTGGVDTVADSGGSGTVTASDTDGPATATSNASTGPFAETTGDTGSVPGLTFLDDFERPDAAAIGNGWWEKTPAAFRLQGGRVARVDVDSNYSNNLVLRPEDEAPRDVELVLTIHPLIVSPFGNPQIHARVQPDDVEVADSVTCYLLYVDDSDLLHISRQEAGQFAGEATQPLAEPLDLGSVYRLRMRIEGEDPVSVDGYLERAIAREPGWAVHTEVHLVDDSPSRILTAGRLGFSANRELEYFEYDDFGYTILDP